MFSGNTVALPAGWVYSIDMNTETMTETGTCGTCQDTGWQTCHHPTTEIDDGEVICLTCDETIDGQEQPQQTLCRDCQ